jgi:hypothetical protein
MILEEGLQNAPKENLTLMCQALKAKKIFPISGFQWPDQLVDIGAS